MSCEYCSTALGAGGRGFESRRPDKHFKPLVFKELRLES